MARVEGSGDLSRPAAAVHGFIVRLQRTGNDLTPANILLAAALLAAASGALATVLLRLGF